jgi:hypothetical protein
MYKNINFHHILLMLQSKSVISNLGNLRHLICIFILQDYRLRFIVHTRLFKIFKRSVRICLPKFFYLVYLLSTDLPCPQLLLFRWDLQKCNSLAKSDKNKSPHIKNRKQYIKTVTLTSHCKKHRSSIRGHH